MQYRQLCRTVKQAPHVMQRNIDIGKLRIHITSVFEGVQTLDEKLFLIADRKMKNYLAKTESGIQPMIKTRK